MYQPLNVCVKKDGRLEAAFWTKTLVLWGARVVALKSKFLLMSEWVCAERSKEVESDHGLGNETIPVLGGKVGVA